MPVACCLLPVACCLLPFALPVALYHSCQDSNRPGKSTFLIVFTSILVHCSLFPVPCSRLLQEV
ncbi:MAG: hypothetical protein F6K50_05925 [Moorea sp. SIO3I7]|uniref:hypothetical protein n=1 Tax=Moorena sp. SIO3I8 TaxID=2607833 RepID=UPI0013C247A9|nr:hypothetical protein [Moorena sp. SIO3I8]NEN95079.1 hypothetical protein [Moorena sp. SIO3I7]NEO06326.1 hypothetical protein [Moorena sp. SIO3I8]